MGFVFERICRDWMIREAGENRLPFFFTQIGRWWGGNPQTRKQEEVDIMAISMTEAILSECKWLNEPVNREMFENLSRRSRLFSYEKYICIYFLKMDLQKDAERLPSSRMV